jgi:glycosyltransferase involved in cell wall biosynthesis
MIAHHPVGAHPERLPFSRDPRDLRTLLCAAGEVWGGVEQFVLTFAAGLNAAGVDVVVALFHEALLAERLRTSGVRVQILRFGGKYDPRGARELRQLLLRARIDVLHVHGYRATVAGALATAGLPVKLLRTVHGLPEPMSSWRGLPRHLRLFANAALERVASVWAADGLVFVSRDLQRRTPASRPVKQRVIFNGIDDAQVAVRNRRWAIRGVQPFRLGIVGRLSAVKGHRYALLALARLRHLPLALHVFGAGPLEQEYRTLCATLRLDDRVVFHGFEASMAERFATLDALIIPSLHEGLPYTLLEAMCAGLPVIASRVGGMTEVIESSGGGLLVPPSDDAALARAVERLAGDPDLCARLGARAREEVRRRFLTRHMLKSYLDLYADVTVVNA